MKLKETIISIIGVTVLSIASIYLGFLVIAPILLRVTNWDLLSDNPYLFYFNLLAPFALSFAIAGVLIGYPIHYLLRKNKIIEVKKNQKVNYKKVFIIAFVVAIILFLFLYVMNRAYYANGSWHLL